MKAIILICLSFSLCAEIYDIKEFQAILAYITPDTCCLCDIDNTLLEPANEQQIASEQWFNGLYKHFLTKLPQEIALQEAIDHYCCISLNMPMKLVEENMAHLIECISERCLCIGFTMRSLVVAPRTIRHLADLKITFTPYFHDHGFMIDKKYPVMMYQNVLFCQGKKNGKTLFEVFAHYGFSPSRIVMIDDKIHYLLDIQAECEKRNIEFIGLRYGYLDEKVQNFVFDQAIHHDN